MTTRKSKFTAQPALDKALWKKRACAKALAEAHRTLAVERAALAELNQRIAKTVQRIREQHDHLTRPFGPQAPTTMIEQHRFIVRLQGIAAQLQDEGAAQGGRVRWAEERVMHRREELVEASRAADALTKARERWVRQQRKAADRACERARSDDVVTRWSARSL